MNKTTKYIQHFTKLREEYKSLQEIVDKFQHKEYFLADVKFYDVYNLTELQNFCFVVCDTYGKFDINAGAYVKRPLDSLKEFNEGIKKLRKNKLLITDYKLERKSNKHVLVIKLPYNQNNVGLSELLLNGRYSEMYTEEEIKNVYKEYVENANTSEYIKKSNATNRNIKGVLLRKEEYKAIFRKMIADKYKCDEEFVETEGELDLPLKEEWKGELINPSESFLYQVGVRTIKDLKITSPELITA